MFQFERCNMSGTSPLPVAYRQSVPAAVNASFMASMAVPHVVGASTFVAPLFPVISLPIPVSPVTVPSQ